MICQHGKTGSNRGLSSLKFSVRKIKKKLKVCKTDVHNAIMKYQNEGIFIDRKRSGQPRVTSSREDRLISKVVDRPPINSTEITQAKLKETGTVVSTKTIQRRLPLEFGLILSKPAHKPRLTQVIKEKLLDFAKRHANWDINMWKRVFFFRRVFCTAVFSSNILGLEACWSTLR